MNEGFEVSRDFIGWFSEQDRKAPREHAVKSAQHATKRLVGYEMLKNVR